MRHSWLSFLIWFVCFVPKGKAVTIVGGASYAGTASLAEGIGVGSDGVGYIFITPRHFLHTHVGAPATIGGIVVNSGAGARLTTAGDSILDIGELTADLPGLTPLPVLANTGALSDYTNMDLRVFGNTGFSYGVANTGASTSFTINDDRTPGTPTTIQLLDFFGSQPDLNLFVDYRSLVGTNGTGIVYSGDSNGGLVANVGGTLYAAGSALGIIDLENPLRESVGPVGVDAGVFPFIGYHQTAIENYLATRSGVLGTTITANFVDPFGIASVPEPGRAILFIFAALILGMQRKPLKH